MSTLQERKNLQERINNAFLSHYRNPQGEIIIRFDDTRWILSEKEWEEMRKEVNNYLALVAIGLDTPTPLMKMAIHIIANSY